MRTNVIAISGALVCAATAVLAVDLPARKPGLWEVTLNMAGGKIPPRAMKFCTDAETDASLYKLGMNAAQGMCSRHDIQRSGNNVTIHIPKSTKTVSAKFPNGQEPNFEKSANSRAVLADWITAAENPYFAKATVNRVWSHFFGNGLVEPVDDLTQEREKNLLLEELAKQFAQHKFDLKYLIRAIVSSRAYQATSIARNENSDELRLFARMPVRALSPEQIYESLAEVTRIQEQRDPRDANSDGRPVMQTGGSSSGAPAKTYTVSSFPMMMDAGAPKSAICRMYLPS